MRWVIVLLTALLLTAVLSLAGCRELGGARQELEHGQMMRQTIKPPSGALDDLMRGGKRTVQEIELAGEEARARKIEGWAEKGLEKVVDKGPEIYDLYTKLDGDLDGHLDSDDNCPDIFNSHQDDSDGDGYGDVCDSAENSDFDSRPDLLDNCPNAWNSSQVDMDGDGYDYTIDIDNDGDFVLNEDDHFDWSPAYY